MVKKTIGIGATLLLLGTGCALEPSTPISYVTYGDQETGIAFDVPAGSALHDGVNGVDDVWKFEYDGDSYGVSFNTYRDGAAIYAAWDGPQPAGSPERQVTRLDDRTIYTLEGKALTEVYFVDEDPIFSILVTKHEGEAVKGEMSPSDDEMFRHLVDSVTWNGEKAFVASVTFDEWQTYTNTDIGFSLRYPGDSAVDLAVDEVTLPDDPKNQENEKRRSMRIFLELPKYTSLDELGCLNALGPQPQKTEVTYGDIGFCLTTTTEGAAGSQYRSYDYVTSVNGAFVDVHFTVQLSNVIIGDNCVNDDEDVMETCRRQATDETRDITLFEEIMQTLTVTSPSTTE